MVMNLGCPTIALLLTVLVSSGGRRRPSYGEHFSGASNLIFSLSTLIETIRSKRIRQNCAQP